ncbi:STAS domain-containing protein [Thermodesulfobacteriota bacterium]
MEEHETDRQSSQISSSRVGASNVISPSGLLTYQNRDKLEAVFDELISQNRTRIILDFKSVIYLDSEALELLVKVHSTLKTGGGVLKVVGFNPVCRDIFLATRLNNIFHIHEDLAEALRN